MKKIILIDGNSIMYRGFYATLYGSTVMKTKEGVYTNAVYSFINMINKLINGYDYAFVSFDAGKETFRHKMYSEYKGTRKSAPVELYEQIPLIKEFLDIMNIKRLEMLEYEADDLIASVANKVKEQFDEILVVSGDQDLLQLVDKKITVALTKNDLDYYTHENFYSKLGFYPNQIIEYKGLVGDKSDNLLGIKGVGEKTAVKLLSEYQTVNNIYNNLDKLTPKLQALFNEHKSVALKCVELATLVKDVNISLTDFKIDSPNYNKLIEFYTKLEFNSFLKKLKIEDNLEAETLSESNDYSLIKDKMYLVSEVNSINYKEATFYGLAIYSNNTSFFVTDLNEIKSYLENSSIKKYCYDLKKINYFMLKNDICLRGVEYDLLLASYLIDPSYPNDDFKVTIEHFIDTNLSYDIYKNKNITLGEVKNYGMHKAKELSKAVSITLDKIKENEQEYLFEEELDLSFVLSKMEINGLKVDLDLLNSIGVEFSNKLNELEKEIYSESKVTFNINSPKQLGDVLFEVMKIPNGKKNKTGYVTNSDVLTEISKNYRIGSLILEYRGLAKLISTYVNGIIEVSTDSFIYPLYKQAYTNTGRLSSINPNIQNMPIRTSNGEVIRKIFKSRFEDGSIISCDYSQIELRVLASISNDPIMKDAFINNIDIHTQTAAQIFECSIEDVTKDMRKQAKAINFGIIYGMSSWGLSEQLDITQLEANIFINKYFHNFKISKECLDNFIKEAKETGYSKTIFNRKRFISELSNSNKSIYAFGERTAMNSPIQGSAADIMKISMNKVNRALERLNLKTLMICTVHDELLFDCPKDEVSIVLPLIKKVMEEAVKLNVPLIANAFSGKNWYEAK